MKPRARLLWILFVLALAQAAAVLLLVTGLFTAGLAVLASSHAILLAGTLMPNSRLFGPIVTRSSGVGLLITIDDGPDPRTTPELLEVLREHRLRAVFFLIGTRAERHPELVLAIEKEGHEIGNHTYSHAAGRFWCIGPKGARREVERCDAVIESLTGEKPKFFRSPAGHSNPFVRLAAIRAGKTLMGWSVRGFDGVRTPRSSVLRRLKRAHQIPDAILLLHEGYDPAERGYDPAGLLTDFLRGRPQ